MNLQNFYHHKITELLSSIDFSMSVLNFPNKLFSLLSN